MSDLPIRETLDHILGGRIRIPAFQRGFVWDPDRVAYLMDSLYKGYPIGTLLFWRTKSQLQSERRLGPYELPRQDPDYPIDYVLDGQQRLTSVFGVFQTQLEPIEEDTWLPIYFDYRADLDAQEPVFFALHPQEIEPERHFPLSSLFDSARYRAATRNFDEETANVIDEMQARFKEVQLPVQTFETDDRARVGIVFERVNRLGVALDTFQLLSAWTWSDDFDLQTRFRDLADQLAPFGFSAVGEDPNLLLRCCAAVVATDASPSALVNLNGARVRAEFDRIESGLQGAIDFLKTNLHVHDLSNLPYTSALVPLTAFFASDPGRALKVTDDQRRELIRWFWRCCFSRRYSSGVLRNLKADIEAMGDLKRGMAGTRLSSFSASVDEGFFLDNTFISSTVNTKTFVLMLAQKQPRSFVSGQPVSLAEVLKDYNRNEFHHLYPRAHLTVEGRENADINRLANFVFMSSVDNKTLGGRAPSGYRARMPADVADILEHAICPESLFLDDYDSFRHERAVALAAYAQALIA